MRFLLDTNVVSEMVQVKPNAGVMTWLAEADEDDVYVSVITLAELRYGVERLRTGKRRMRLAEWLHGELPLRFEGRIVPIDDVVAGGWGKVVARRKAVGRPIGAMDAFVAATAIAYEMTIVTRNVSDFTPSLKGILDPWT
jgi:toxin FitB